MKTNWNNRSAGYKAMVVFRLVASIGVVVFAALQLFGVWERAIHFAAPMMGAVLLVQSIQEWKQHRAAAVVSLCAAVFIFGCAIVVWFVK